MTYAPKSLKEVQDLLHNELKLPYPSLGIVGDDKHLGGYHCGSDRTVPNDYSIADSSRDRNGLTEAASALDIGWFTKSFHYKTSLLDFNAWLIRDLQTEKPDNRDIREVIYTPDGKVVKRWDRLKKQTGGSKSHLTHTHISYFRDSERRDKTALFKRWLREVKNMPLTDADAVKVWTTDKLDPSPLQKKDDPKNEHRAALTILHSARDNAYTARVTTESLSKKVDSLEAQLKDAVKLINDAVEALKAGAGDTEYVLSDEQLNKLLERIPGAEPQGFRKSNTDPIPEDTESA